MVNWITWWLLSSAPIVRACVVPSAVVVETVEAAAKMAMVADATTTAAMAMVAAAATMAAGLVAVAAAAAAGRPAFCYASFLSSGRGRR